MDYEIFEICICVFAVMMSLMWTIICKQNVKISNLKKKLEEKKEDGLH